MMADLQAHLNNMGTLNKNRRELSTAASNGDIQRVFSILERTGIDVNFVDPDLPRMFYTPVPPPLLAACQTGQLELVRALLSRCKDIQVNIQLHGETPLSAAAKNGYVEIMKLLFNHGASLGDNSVTTSSPLVCAVQNGKYEVAKLLLQKGANQNGSPFGLTSHPPLMIAAGNGHSNLVKLLLDNGANTEQDPFPSALTLACGRGYTECAQLLIERGANLNAGGSMGTPLACAVENHHTACVKLLLEKGADVNKPGNMGETPLMVASRRGHVNEVELLLKYGAIMTIKVNNFTALYLACRDNHLKVAEMLIENGANVNQIPDKALEIQLEAINRSYSDIACLLIRNGARLNTATVFGETPLKCAVQKNNLRVVKELVQHGANIDVHLISITIEARNPDITNLVLQKANSEMVRQVNETLLKAAVDGDSNFAETLISYVSDINVPLQYGNTALIEAAKCGKDKHVKLLLAHWAQVNIQNEHDGNTALIVASQGGHARCVEQLLTQKDTNVNLQNRSECTALILASENGHTSIVKLLLQHNDIDINLQNDSECTALMIASEKGHASVVQVLLANKANLEILNTRRCTALFLGVKSNNPAVVELLLGGGADASRKALDGKDIIQYAYECHKEPEHSVIQMLQTAQAKELQSQDGKLKEAFRILLPLAHEWQNIGVLLDIPDGDLKAVGAENSRATDCLREMLRKWLSHVDPRPTCMWTSLANATELFDPSKADEIRRKYCSHEESSAEMQQLKIDQDSVEDQNREETDENTAKVSSDILIDSQDDSKTENVENPGNEEHLAAIEKAMKKKGTLKHNLSHGVMVGPAGSGKSSLMSRLVGEMPIFLSPSTGVADKVVQISVRKSHTVALSVQDTIWYKLLYDQEAIQLMHLLPTQSTTQSQPQEPPQPNNSPLTQVQIIPDSISSTVPNVHEPLPTSTKHTTKSYPEGYVTPIEVFKGVIKGKSLESLQQHFKNSWSFYLTDCGGQVEFQELLPLLVSGPSVFFFTFRLNQDLHQRFTIEYHLSDGGRSEPYQSTLTVEETILQTLASVASMGTFTYNSPQVRSASLKPKMFIIGTHKDMLNPATADSYVEAVDKYLQKLIKSTSFYHEDVVQFASESQLIYTVNNFSEDDSDFIKIRLGVERVVCHRQFEVHFPAHWLIFSLALRQETIKESIISYEQCFSIAQDCGITDYEELNHALWFLHTKIGLIRHFPTPGLNDFVIRDPQILFDMVTKLVVNTFTFEKADMPSLIEFKKKGVFTLKEYLALQEESPPLPPEKLLQLLEQLQIIAPFQEDDQEKFFIPCVLAHSDEIDSQSSPHSSDVPPLLITFKCGYCPKGFPGALITHFLTNKMGSKFKWELMSNQIFQNQVSFLLSSCDIITLKIYPTFLELTHSLARESKHSDRLSIFSEVCSHVQSSIRNVSSKMSLTSNADHSLSFYCQNSDCIQSSGSHPATKIVEDVDGTMSLLCNRSNNAVVSELPQHSEVWLHGYSEELELRYQAYQQALQRGAKVSIVYLKFLFYGPPRTGKTSARRRLVGEILNLMDEGNPLVLSTGAAERKNIRIQLVDEDLTSTTALLSRYDDAKPGAHALRKRWTCVSGNESDLEEELLLLYKFIHEESQITSAQNTTHQSSNPNPANLKSHKSKPLQIEVPERNKTETTTAQQEPEIEAKESGASSLRALSSTSVIAKDLLQKHDDRKLKINEAFTAFDNILKTQKRDEYLNVLLEGTSLINMVDTGGQPAFLEMIPVLTVGPAMYLVFMNLTQELKKRYKVEYVTKDEAISLDSSYTIQEVLFQILSSIVAFSRIEGVEHFPDSSQAALIVGTYKDELLASGANLTEKDKAVQLELKQVLQNDSGLLCRASEESLVLAIDNMTGDKHEVETMRNRLEAIIESKFKKHEIPAAWLMFNIFLRKLGIRVLSLVQCEDIARRLHVTDYKEALWFFHHIVGSLMYFPTVEELEDSVICDPQLLFDNVTTLIIQTFDTADTATRRFKETGQFNKEDIEKTVPQTSDECLSLTQLTKLLKHLNIIAPIAAPSHSRPNSSWYFFPAILKCATNEQLQEFEQNKEPNDPLPLMIHFKFGFVPIGLFCATIANLVSQIYSEKLGWVFETADHKPLYKNMLTFHTGDACDVTLISRPKRFEVHLTKTGSLEISQTTEQCSTCISVIETICDALDRVISKIKHLNLASSTKEPIYQLGFKCPLHNHSDSDDLLLNTAQNGTSAVSRSPKDLWYGFLEDKSYFQCLNSTGKLSKNEVFNPKFLSCLSWFPISDHKSLRLLLIDEHPKSQSKEYGDEVFFDVKAILTGHGIETETTEPFEYQWFKDNEEVTLKTHPYCRGANESILHINSLLAQYEGNYKCKVSSQQDGNVAYTNEATLKISTPFSWQLLKICSKESSSTNESVPSPDFNASNYKLLPLVPPTFDVVDCKGRVLLGPDEGITINIPSGAVADNDTIHIQIQSFVPAQDDTIVLPQGLKLFSPIYQVSTSCCKFQKTVELSMSHYAKLLSRKDVSKLVFLHSTYDEAYPHMYEFRVLEGGEFDFDSCKGSIHLQKFCGVAVAGSEDILVEYSLFFIHSVPKLNSKCMCAVFSACYRHNAYLKYLMGIMEKDYPDAKPFHPEFMPVELAEGSQEFGLIIPHEEAKKQGYLISVVGRDRSKAKISIKEMPPYPPQESADSAGFPSMGFPLPYRRLYVEILSKCAAKPTEDLECDLKFLGVKGDIEPFVLRAEAPAYVSEKTDTITQSDWTDIVKYLKKLNQQQIKRLGGKLGLNVFNLNLMKTLPDDMVTAWLQREDNVIEKCGRTLTWEVLVKALVMNGHNGIAEDIVREKCKKGSCQGNTQTQQMSTDPSKEEVKTPKTSHPIANEHSKSRSRSHSKDRQSRYSRSRSWSQSPQQFSHGKRLKSRSRSNSSKDIKRKYSYSHRKSWSRSRSRSQQSRSRSRSRSQNDNRRKRKTRLRSKDRDRSHGSSSSRRSQLRSSSPKKPKHESSRRHYRDRDHDRDRDRNHGRGSSSTSLYGGQSRSSKKHKK